MYESAIKIIRRLRDRGYEAYLAGGCVRSRLLGLSPKDYDIATNALPGEVEGLFEHTVAVGKAFGVIVVLMDGYTFEVATFRADGRYIDGRRPESVRFADWQSDVRRRDFTINGMIYDPINDRLFDIVGGQDDIRNRVVRTIGDPLRRFEEDKLRMIRAIRFACQLGFQIEGSTQEAIKALAHKITQVSFERIRDEFKLILLSEQRSRGMDLLYKLGILKEIMPEVIAMDGVPQPPEFHPEGDVWTHTKLSLEFLKHPSFELAMATLLHDVGKPVTLEELDGKIHFYGHEGIGANMTRAICLRLKLSHAETEKICWLVAKHMVYKDVTKMRQSTLKRLLGSEYYPELEALFLTDKMASDRDLTSYNYIQQARQRFSLEELRPEPLLRGRDLLGLGLKPGPIFSKILRAVEDAQLEGKIRTPEEALNFVRKNFNI
jgi:poly(A) polymerase